MKNEKRKSSGDLLEKIQTYIGGVLRFSYSKNTPHLVVDGKYSICYFRRSDFFRIFDNYGLATNKKLIDLRTFEEVVVYFHYVLELPFVGKKTLPYREIRDHSVGFTRWELLDIEKIKEEK